MPLGKDFAYRKLWEHDVWGEDRDCEIFKIEMITSPDNYYRFFSSEEYDSSEALQMMTATEDYYGDWEQFQHTGYETYFEIEVTAVDSTTDIQKVYITWYNDSACHLEPTHTDKDSPVHLGEFTWGANADVLGEIFNVPGERRLTAVNNWFNTFYQPKNCRNRDEMVYIEDQRLYEVEPVSNTYDAPFTANHEFGLVTLTMMGDNDVDYDLFVGGRATVKFKLWAKYYEQNGNYYSKQAYNVFSFTWVLNPETDENCFVSTPYMGSQGYNRRRFIVENGYEEGALLFDNRGFNTPYEDVEGFRFLGPEADLPTWKISSGCTD